VKRSFRRTILLFLVLAYYTLFGGTSVGVRSLPHLFCSHLLLILVLLVWTLPKLLKGISIPQSPIDLPLMIFLLTVVASFALSSDGRLSLGTTLHLVSLALLFYFLLDMLLQGWSSSDLATAVLMTGGVVTMVGLWELLLWHESLGNGLSDIRGWQTTFLSLSTHGDRITLGLTNHLEMFFVLAIPLAISRLVATPSRWTKLALLAWFGGTGILLLSTFSRGWLLGVGVSLITMSLTMIWPRLGEPLQSLRRLERTTWAQIALLTTSGSILILASYATAAWLFRMRLPIDPLLVRVNLWASGFRIIRGFPLLGTGPGTFGWALHVIGDPAGVFSDRFFEHAHSLFMNVAVETGLTGLVALLALMATATLACARLWIKESQRSRDRIGGSDPFTVWPMLAGLTGLVAWSLFDVPAAAPFSGVYAIAYLAVAMQPLSRPARRCSRWFAVALFLCIVGIALLLIPIDIAHYYQSKALESVKQGNLTHAVVLLDKAAVLDPNCGVYPFQRGIVFGLLAVQTGDAEKTQAAISDYETTILRGDDFAENNLQLGWLAWRAGCPTEALAQLRRAAQLAPYNSRYHLGLGYILEELGDVESAADFYAAAIALSPGLIRSGFWQTTAFRRQLKPDLITKAVALLPTLRPGDNYDDQLWMATLAYYGDDLSSATGFLNASQPTPSYYLLRGKIAEQQGNWGLARTHFDEALQTRPTFGAAYLERGRLYARLGSLERAQNDLHTAAALGVADADVALGLLAYQSGDILQAISNLQAGLRPPCPSLPPGYLYATNVWHRVSLEVEFAPDIIRCAPRDELIPAYLYLAKAYGRTNQPNKAAEICQWLGSFYAPPYIQQWAPGELAGSSCEEAGNPMPSY